VTPIIGILNLKLGNLGSVVNALAQNGFDAVVVDDPARIEDLTHLVVPGVGHFTAAMAEAKRMQATGAVRRFAASGRPVLGICLGMQLLASHGYEGEGSAGFDLIPGRVDRLPVEPGLRLPHVGWNRVMPLRAHPVLDGIKPERDFYFVHTYAYTCADAGDVLAETDYGQRFTSLVARGNIVGAQFHPEKSQVSGLRMLENFCLWDGRC
jgi:glutamine amidotransferase